MPVYKLPGETDKEYRARWMREWRKANPDKRNDSQYNWRKNNPDRVKEVRANWLESRIKREPDYWANKQRRANGLPTPTRKCPELCEVCSRPETRIYKTGKRFSLALDHCHTTGVFRGWLCARCNTTLGRYNDDYETIQKLADYLRKTDSESRNA